VVGGTLGQEGAGRRHLEKIRCVAHHVLLISAPDDLTAPGLTQIKSRQLLIASRDNGGLKLVSSAREVDPPGYQ